MKDLDIVYRADLHTITDDSLARILTNNSQSISLVDIPIMSLKELIAHSNDYVQILIKILGYFNEEELSSLSQICKLWSKIVFIMMMNQAFKYEKHQVKSSCNHEIDSKLRDIAFKYYKLAMKVCPSHYAPWYYWARFNVTTSLYGKRQTSILKKKQVSYVKQKTPNQTLKLVISSYLEFDIGNAEASLSLCKEALTLDDNNAEAWLLYSFLLHTNQQYKNALKAYSHCKNLPSGIKYEVSILQSLIPNSSVEADNPYFYDPRTKLNIDEVKKTIEKLEAKSSGANLSLGVLYYNLGRHCIKQYLPDKEAINYLNMAIKHGHITAERRDLILANSERRHRLKYTYYFTFSHFQFISDDYG